jgi:hypothetical protein
MRALLTCALPVLALGAQPVAGTVQASAQREAFESQAQKLRRTAIDRGLQWLVAHQQDGGGWLGDVGHKQEDSYLVLRSTGQQRLTGSAHVGVSALAGLAFLATGHVPDRGDHGTVVRRTLDYVMRCVAENGYVADSGTNMYSHAFATLFLAEVYGVSRDPRARDALDRAIVLIVDCQNSLGAWRYYPFTPEADLSVTVCQLQALRAARNNGIRVPRQAIDRAVRYVESSRIDNGWDRGLFTYKIQGPSAFRKNREYAVNAAASTTLYSAGVHDEKLHGPVLEFLADEYPQIASYYSDHFYFWYGNLYASQAFFQAGGERFEGFYPRLCADLLRLQADDGRWINRVGPGDEFATAVACLILALPQQYLPIFQR